VEIVWSQKQVTALIHIWNILSPLKLIFTASSFYFYAGAWVYISPNPFHADPFGISPFVILFMFPFYVPGIIIGSYVWRCFKNPNLTRYKYIETIIVLQIIYILVIWILIPCPISTDPPLCIPVPSTGLVALLFVSKVVKKLDSPWTEPDSEGLGGQYSEKTREHS